VLNDLQTISGIINNIYAQYNSLTPAEKQEFARTLAANQWWLDEVNTATNTLIQDVVTYKNQAVVLNYEDRVMLSIFRFETALTVVLLHIPQVALWVGGGATFGTFIIPGLGSGLGAALGAGVGISLMLSDVQLLMASIDRMVNTAMLPTETWFCNKTNDFVGFTNMAAKTVTVNMTYRTVYNADANTSTPIAQRFIKGMADLRSGLNTIAQYLPASLRQSKIIQSVTNYRTLPLAVNSQQLTVSDISNSNVNLVNTDKTDGILALTFKNNASTDQSFSFKLNYNNSDFGSFTKVIDANITGVASISLLDSNLIGHWKCTTWYDDFWGDYLNRSYTYCTCDDAACKDTILFPKKYITETYVINTLELTFTGTPASTGYSGTYYFDETDVFATENYNGGWYPCDPILLPPDNTIENYPNCYFTYDNTYSTFQLRDVATGLTVESGQYQWLNPNEFKLDIGAGDYKIYTRQ